MLSVVNRIKVKCYFNSIINLLIAKTVTKVTVNVPVKIKAFRTE